MSITPRLTVLMAVFNGEQFIKESIISILSQSYQLYEFIIVNDGSTDRTLEIIDQIKDSRIKIISNSENLGLTKSLNIGLEHAKGKYIARIDADDIAHKDRLAVQVNFLDSHPGIVLIGTNVRVINHTGHVEMDLEFDRPSTDASVKWMLLFGNPFVHSSVMFRRKEIWDELGGYNADFRYNQDFEMWSRVLRDYSAVNIKDILNDFRSNPFSITRQRGKKNAQVWERTLKQNIDVQNLNLISIFGKEHEFHEWPQLWTIMNQPHSERGGVDIGRLLSLFVAMRYVYMQGELSAVSVKEILNISESVMVRIARYAAGSNRIVAIKIFFMLAKEYPTSLLNSLPKLMITFVFGHVGAAFLSRIYKSTMIYINFLVTPKRIGNNDGF